MLFEEQITLLHRSRLCYQRESDLVDTLMFGGKLNGVQVCLQSSLFRR